jgi:hypothetical protein
MLILSEEMSPQDACLRMQSISLVYVPILPARRLFPKKKYLPLSLPLLQVQEIPHRLAEPTTPGKRSPNPDHTDSTRAWRLGESSDTHPEAL